MTWHHEDGRTCLYDDGAWLISQQPRIECLRAHGSIPSPLDQSFRPESGEA